MKKRFLEVGQIVSTHGIRGEVRFNPWCDSPEYLKQFRTLYFDPDGKKSVGVISARPHSNIVILKLENIDTVEKAQALKNTVLYIDRNDAKEGTVFVQDLIGCSVFDEKSGKLYGKISRVSENPANNIWHIVSDSGKEYLFPAVDAFIGSIDTDAETVKVNPIKGLFDEAEEIRDEN